MNGDTDDRAQLRDLLLDSVAPLPDGTRDAMFDHTFAAGAGDGADLLPPDGMFDDPYGTYDADDAGYDGTGPDDPGYDPGYDPAYDQGDGDTGYTEAAYDEPASTEWSDDGATTPATADPGADPSVDPSVDGSGAGW